MTRFLRRRLGVLGCLSLWVAAAGWFAFAPAARADLVYTPGEGWEYKGGVLGPLFGDMGAAKSALELMNNAKAAQDGGRYWSALSQYDQVVSDYPGSVFAPEALFQEGVIYINRHQFEKAFTCFDRIVKRYPDYPNFDSVVRQQFNVADLMTTERPYLWGWMPWFKDPAKAFDYYNTVVKIAPATEYAPMSLMKIALLALKESWFLNQSEASAQAIEALRQLINDYPQSMFASDAYLQLAQIYSNMVIGPAYDQGATRQAIRYLQDYLFYYRETRSAADAEKQRNDMLDTYARSQLLLGNFYYYYRNSNRAALIFYNQAVTIAPQSPAAADARAQIDKINRGILAPMTPYDWVFGRYNDHALSLASEQGRIEKLAAAAFEARSAEEFIETPGTETVETISSSGQTQEYQTFEPFLNPTGAPPPAPNAASQLIPAPQPSSSVFP